MWLTASLGVLSGLALGLTGGGGSIVAVPLLVYLNHSTPHQAVFISLVSVFVTASVGAIYRWRKQELQFNAGVLMIIGGFIGTPVGTWLNQYFSPIFLMVLFALLMLLVGFRMWQSAKNKNNLATDFLTENTKNSTPILVASGLVTGVLTGLFGVGGGFLIVPALVFAAKLPIRRAMATSLFVISLTCLAGIVTHLFKSSGFDHLTAVYFSVGSLLGMFVGIWFSHQIPVKGLKRGFSVLVILLGIFVLVQQVLLAFLGVTSMIK